jgi:prepilin-type processing-associated H-X9-DG protein
MELVVVIAIIAGIASITIPAYNSIKLAAVKMQDASKLKKIGAAWYEATVERGWQTTGATNGTIYVTYFIEQLAGAGKTSLGDILFNDPYVVISSADKYACKIVNKSICVFKNGQVNKAGAYGVGPSNIPFIKRSTYMISFCFVVNLPKDVPLDTTPLGCTRGLRADGKWDETSGIYGSKGGHILFADGHVKWFDGDKPVMFLKWDQSGYTTDIRKAIPPGTWITCGAKGDLKTDYKDPADESTRVILDHASTADE